MFKIFKVLRKLLTHKCHHTLHVLIQLINPGLIPTDSKNIYRLSKTCKMIQWIQNTLLVDYNHSFKTISHDALAYCVFWSFGLFISI